MAKNQTASEVVAKIPAIGGGSTTVMIASMSAQKLVGKEEIMAMQEPAKKAVALENAFAKLRETITNIELSSNKLAQSIDDEKSFLPANSKEAKRLENDFLPYRRETTELAATAKSLKDKVNSQYPEFMAQLNNLKQQINQGNVKPSLIDPVFSSLRRIVNDRNAELEKLQINDRHAVTKMQTIAKEVTYHVVAAKSSLANTNDQQLPQNR